MLIPLDISTPPNGGREDPRPSQGAQTGKGPSPAQSKPGPGQISGNLEIWDLEIWKFWIQKIKNMKILKIKIRVAQNVGKVGLAGKNDPGGKPQT